MKARSSVTKKRAPRVLGKRGFSAVRDLIARVKEGLAPSAPPERKSVTDFCNVSTGSIVPLPADFAKDVEHMNEQDALEYDYYYDLCKSSFSGCLQALKMWAKLYGNKSLTETCKRLARQPTVSTEEGMLLAADVEAWIRTLPAPDTEATTSQSQPPDQSMLDTLDRVHSLLTNADLCAQRELDVETIAEPWCNASTAARTAQKLGHKGIALLLHQIKADTVEELADDAQALTIAKCFTVPRCFDLLEFTAQRGAKREPSRPKRKKAKKPPTLTSSVPKVRFEIAEDGSWVKDHETNVTHNAQKDGWPEILTIALKYMRAQCVGRAKGKTKEVILKEVHQRYQAAMNHPAAYDSISALFRTQKSCKGDAKERRKSPVPFYKDLVKTTASRPPLYWLDMEDSLRPS